MRCRCSAAAGPLHTRWQQRPPLPQSCDNNNNKNPRGAKLPLPENHHPGGKSETKPDLNNLVLLQPSLTFA